MRSTFNSTWPVLTTYDANHLARIALPLGGIGTGTVSLGGRGDLHDWEIVNRPAKTFTPPSAHMGMGPAFLISARQAGKDAVTKVLEGPLDLSLYEGSIGATVLGHGLPRFRNCQFAAAYPFGQVLLTDPTMPLDVRLEAFNPLIPADADASGVPVAVMRYVLINRSSKPVKASVCGSLPNFIGADGVADACTGNINAYRESGKVRGLFMSTTGTPAGAEQFGTMALTTTTAGPTSHWTNVPDDCMGWYGGQLEFWQDFSDDGRLDAVTPMPSERPHGLLTVSVTVPPKASKEVTFLLTWHFPNRQTWSPIEADNCCDGGDCCSDQDQAPAQSPNWIGNYYTTKYADAWD
ncbi:MAG: GH116 family glycosyl-hydrolase, partial [Planctomycetota bacterium]